VFKVVQYIQLSLGRYALDTHRIITVFLALSSSMFRVFVTSSLSV